MGNKKIRSCFIERREKVSDKLYEPLSVTKAGILPQLETAVKTDNGDNRKKFLKETLLLIHVLIERVLVAYLTIMVLFL